MAGEVAYAACALDFGLVLNDLRGLVGLEPCKRFREEKISGIGCY